MGSEAQDVAGVSALIGRDRELAVLTSGLDEEAGFYNGASSRIVAMVVGRDASEETIEDEIATTTAGRAA